MAAEQEWTLANLPAPVRAQILRWTAEVLPDVQSLPGSLRRVAAFAPARRARAGSTALTDALSDDTFREAVAVQVAAATSDAETDDRVRLAAHAWLDRREGWGDAVALVAADLGQRGQDASGVEADRLRGRVAALEEQVRSLKEEHRSRTGDLRTENGTLKQRLGETRAQLRDAEARALTAEQAMQEGQATYERERSVLAKELRQAHTRLEAAEAKAAQERKGAKDGRDDATVRARLLLDTLSDAVDGLRRELALPPTAHLPGDRVDAVIAQGLEADDLAARGQEGAAALEHLLGLPQVRLLVDGYNVAKKAWPSSTLEVQRIRLVTPLGALAARTSAETTVVFDAQHSAHRAPTPVPRGIKVVFSPPGMIADDVLVDYVRVEPRGRVVLVVTDDRDLAVRVRTEGAKVIAAEALVALLNR